MSTPDLVQQFYDRIWNAGEVEAVSELLTETFAFRGSLGDELRGRDNFVSYVLSIRGALNRYRCDILTCVAEGDQAFAKMRFSGTHNGVFRNYAATGMQVSWLGAAWFRFERTLIGELWVLGDLSSLDEVLRNNQAATHNPKNG